MNKKILIASVLKPVDDVRMFHKFGKSILNVPGARIHVAGSRGSKDSGDERITFHPIFDFKRSSLRRMTSGVKLFLLLQRLKPDIIIGTTHEVLVPMVAHRILRKCLLIYDVQENYYLNIKYGDTYGGLTKYLLAGYVRAKEKLANYWIDTAIFAEKCYEDQMRFLHNATIIENKFKPYSAHPGNNQKTLRTPLAIIYTGTISKFHGIFDAIHIAQLLLEVLPGKLTILGFAPDSKILREVRALIRSDSRIELVGGKEFVPHHKIIAHIYESNLGIVSYQFNPSFDQKIPTKVYEYLACQLPFIYPDHASWQEMVSEMSGGIALNFSNPNIKELLQKLETQNFYTNSPLGNLFWDAEEKRLLNCIQTFQEPNQLA